MKQSCVREFGQDFKKRFFTERVVGHWNRFAREVVTAPKVARIHDCWMMFLVIWFITWFIVRWSCRKQGVVPNNLYVSLLIQAILQIYDSNE